MWTCFICSHGNSDSLTICAVCHKSRKHSSVDVDPELSQLDFSAVLVKIERYLAAPVTPASLKIQLGQDRLIYIKLKKDFDQATFLASKGKYSQATQLFSLVKAQLSNAQAQAILDSHIIKAEHELKKVEIKRRRRTRLVTTLSSLIFAAALLVAVGLPYYKVKRLENKAELALKKGSIDDAILRFKKLLDITGSEKYRAKGLSLIEWKNRREQEILAKLDSISHLIDEAKLDEALSITLAQDESGKDPRLVKVIAVIKEKLSVREAEAMQVRLAEVARTVPPSLLSKVQRYGFNRKGSFEITLLQEITMVRISAGEFSMGYKSKRKDRMPVHRVHLSEYWIGASEITSEQFVQFSKENGVGDGTTHLNKATRLSWDTADRFCEWLSKRTGLRFSLPSEAQWEKAAMMNGPLSASENSDSVNAYGLRGMYDDIQEWCSDFFDEKYYSTSKTNDPKGPEKGDYHDAVVRGTSKKGPDGRPDFRLRFKASLSPKFKSDKIGFRVVMQ